MNCFEQPLREFVDGLAARTPAPGGGSASALAGAVGAALGNMAAAFTLGNEKFKAVEPEAARLHEQLAALRARCVDLLHQDIAAYSACAAARALPRRSAAEKEARRAALRAANERATAVPTEILSAAWEGLQTLERLNAIVNPNLVSDVAAAAYFFVAAARGAGIQVLCNCAAADNKEEQGGRLAAVKERMAQCQTVCERIHNSALRKFE